jgi:anti-anti-sigma factor
MVAPDDLLTPPALAIERRRQGEDAILAVRGEVDPASADHFEAAITDAATGGCSRIVIDLSDLEFMDSTGLRALLRGQQHAVSQGVRVVLRNVPRHATRLFELSGVTRAFTTDTAPGLGIVT